MSHESLLHSNLLIEALKRIASFELFKLCRSILVKEFIYRKVASANTDPYFAPFNFDSHSSRAELINTLRLSHKHYLELGSIWEVVNVLSQLLVSGVALDRDVDCNTSFEIDNVLFKNIYLTTEARLKIFNSLFSCF